MSDQPILHEQRRVRNRVWILSDLQTARPDVARRCIESAVEDARSLDADFDQLWYLGDAIEGTDVDVDTRIADIQLDLLNSLDLPCRYVLGNHDIEFVEVSEDYELPFYDAIEADPNWRTVDRVDQFYFFDEVGDHTVLFLSDHMAVNNEWKVTHGEVHGDEASYPYSRSDYQNVVERVAEIDGPVIVAGHNAFPGGNRASALQEWFFPLPENVDIHFYGHAHIGDDEWVGKDLYRTISYVDHHDVPQIDVASLEDVRGDTVRSVVLELYEDGAYGVHLRDHKNRAWLERYTLLDQ